MTPLHEAAAAAHELYTSYLSVGFSEDQALSLTIALVTKAGDS